MIYTNTGLTLSQVQVDFDNGQGYQTITLNTAKTVSYSSGGEKALKVNFVYNGGPTLYSHSKIWVDYIVPQGGAMARFNGGNANTEVIKGAVWQGSANAAHVTIELAPGHTQLTKPLIVVEGFDPDGSFNYFSFIDSDRPGGINIDINPDPNVFFSLNDAIEDEDYDLVFIDFVNGTDYIQRNALVVQAVIEEVNTRKALAGSTSTEKNVVMGMSMGGLVARYALRHMEINNETHDTKLYISHDTPHQGANVPLGFQALARHLYGEEISIPILFSLIDFDIVSLPSLVPDLNTGYNLLQSPAAQQMLIYQLQGTGANVSVNNNTLHDSFSTELSNMGYPSQNNIRNIAIANGSECGNPLDFNAYDTLVDVNETVDLPFFITNVALAFINLAGWNPLKTITSLLSTNTDIKVQVNVKALPNQESKQIYKGKIFIRKAVLGFIIIHEDLIDQKTVNSSSSMLPLDNANGGVYNIDTFVTLPPEFDSYVLEREFNFIPAFSSLDIGGGNQTIGVSDLNKTYTPLSPPVAPKNTPFNNFFTNPISSEQHVQFTLNNGNWLMDELDNVNGSAFYTCVSACSGNLNLSVQGGGQICNSISRTYTINNIGYGATINWSISPTVDFTITPNGSSVTVTPVNNFNGEATLTASIATNCNDNIELTKKIWKGKADFYLQVLNGSYANFKNIYLNSNIAPLSSQGIYSVTWEKISGTGNIYASTSHAYQAEAYGPAGLNLDAKVTVENACGTQVTYFHVEYGSNGDPCENDLTFKENMISIISCDDDTLSKSTASNSSRATKIELFDLNGVKIGASKNSDYLDIKNVSPGIYIVKASIKDGNVITKKIAK